MHWPGLGQGQGEPGDSERNAGARFFEVKQQFNLWVVPFWPTFRNPPIGGKLTIRGPPKWWSPFRIPFETTPKRSKPPRGKAECIQEFQTFVEDYLGGEQTETDGEFESVYACNVFMCRRACGLQEAVFFWTSQISQLNCLSRKVPPEVSSFCGNPHVLGAMCFPLLGSFGCSAVQKLPNASAG